MNHKITVVSIGNGDPDLLNSKTVNALRDAGSLFLRTGHTPLVRWLAHINKPYLTFDNLYETSVDFDQLSLDITDCILRRAIDSDVVYAVFDALTDNTVLNLVSRVEHHLIEVIPGISYYDLYLSSSLSHGYNNTTLMIVPANDILNYTLNPNQSILITELDTPLLAGQVKLTVNSFFDDDYNAIFFQDSSAPAMIPLYELDRQNQYDHESAVLIPGSSLLCRNRYVLDDLLLLMDLLRSDTGCPWDKCQTHESLLPYLIEEAWECVASIKQQDYDHLSEELGDLLFQIVFHSSIGKSFDEFSMSDVINSICSKMIRRHPHVFIAENKITTDEVSDSWEKLKQNETGHNSLLSSLDDVSSLLPSLKYASKTLKKLRVSRGLRRNDQEIIKDIINHANLTYTNATLSKEIIIGKLLLFCCELGANHNIDPELLLHQSVDSLKARIRIVENKIKNDGKTLDDLTFEELGVYLNHVEGEIE